MSWSNVVSDGGGKWGLRLVVEGWPDVWVTNKAMEGTQSDGRERRSGLSYEGIRLKERTIIKEGRLEVDGFTAIVRSPHALGSLGRTGQRVATLATGADDDDLIFFVYSSGKATSGETLHVGTEAVLVDSIPGATSIVVDRQQWDTQPQSHQLSVLANETEVYFYDHPVTMEGRRAYLYVHTESEFSTTDNGTLVWRGLVAGPPRMESGDGLSWAIDVDPISAVLQQDIAALSDDPALVRGIYYPWTAPFTVVLSQTSDANHGSPDISTIQAVHVTGFFATDQEFMSELNDQLATAVSSLSGADSITANRGTAGTRASFGGGNSEGITFAVETSASPAYVLLNAGSVLDGATINQSLLNDEFGISVTSVSASTAYYRFLRPVPDPPFFAGVEAQWGEAPKSGPRAAIGAPRTTANEHLIEDPSALSSAPLDRIYIDRSMPTVEAIRISELVSAFPTNTVGDRVERDFVVASQGSDANGIYLEIENPTNQAYYLDGDTQITPIYKFDGAGHVDEGIARFDEFVQGTIDLSVNANMGDVPFLTDADIDRSDMSGVLDAMTLFPWQSDRRYVFSEAVSLEEIFEHEVRLLSCYLRLGSDGRITIAQLKRPTATQAGVVPITGEHILTPANEAGMWPQWNPQSDGLVNVIRIETGYNAGEDEHEGPTLRFRHVESISTHKSRGRGEITIAPKSASAFPDAVVVLPEEARKQIASRLFAWLAHDYAVVTIAVSYKLFSSCLVGTAVSVTSPHIVDPIAGTRGVTGRLGLVIGREWNMDPADPMQGRLEIMMHYDAVHFRGYAPAARITGAASAGGGWLLTVEQNRYAPSGEDDNSHFADGDFVEVVEVDSTSPTTATGTITNIGSSTTIAIVFDVGAPWGGAFSGSWDLEFREASGGSNVTENQAEYCYIADDTSLLYNDNEGRRMA